MELCAFSLPISFVIIERINMYIYIYILSYYHHQLRGVNYYPFLGFGHETMLCAVCLSLYLNVSQKFMKRKCINLYGSPLGFSTIMESITSIICTMLILHTPKNEEAHMAIVIQAPYHIIFSYILPWNPVRAHHDNHGNYWSTCLIYSCLLNWRTWSPGTQRFMYVLSIESYV